MEAGAISGRDDRLRRDIALLSPEQFEQLVFELAQRDNPDVRRLVQPDGGADTFLPATDTNKAQVWQAKRYPTTINWQECEKSLARAIRRWQPSAVIFCFPRDLSQRPERSFEAKLVKHPDALREGVQVALWNLSEIVRRLNQHPDLRVRFFGAEQDSLVMRLDRLAKAGGKLETSEDLVERARTLSEFAQQHDVDFEYRIIAGPATAPAPKWDQLPFMTLVIGDERTDVHVSAFVREGAEVPLPTLYFVDSEDGQLARRAAVGALARGEKAIVTHGARLAVHAPQMMRDLTAGKNAVSSAPVELQPGDPVSLELEVTTDEGTLQRRLEMRPVPPLPGATIAFAGYTGAMLLELNFVPLEHQRSGPTSASRPTSGLARRRTRTRRSCCTRSMRIRR